MVYIIQDPKFTHKIHRNQVRKHLLNGPNYAPHGKEEIIETIYDTFDIEPLQAASERCRLGKKKKIH